MFDLKQFIEEEGFKNVGFTDYPTFLHCYNDSGGRVYETKTLEVTAEQFTSINHLRDRINHEKSLGNFVYFYGEPNIIYSSKTFQELYIFKFAVAQDKRRIEEIVHEERMETKLQENRKNYKYLLIGR